MHTIGKLMDSDYEQYHKFGTYDHNFVINGTGFREAAVLQSKESGIRMTCFTDQPGMQLHVWQTSRSRSLRQRTVRNMPAIRACVSRHSIFGRDQPWPISRASC